MLIIKVKLSNKKAQVALEFMTTYVWVLMVVIVVIGAMSYFNLLDPSNYISQRCEFGRNIFCEEWTFERTSSDTFDAKFLFQNNLEKSIVPATITIYDNIDNEITCYEYNLTCPYDLIDPNWTADLNGIFIDSADKWNPGALCKMDLGNCGKAVITGEKETFKIDFAFRRATGISNHTVKGEVFTQIQ